MNTTFLTTLILLALYYAAVRFTPASPVATQSQWQRNQHTLEHYVLGGERVDCVVVGSSLSQRMEFPDGQDVVRNLALAGGSALTGLELIKASGHRPRCILVEINHPERDIDLPTVEKATRALPRISPLFETRNAPINFFLTQVRRFRKEPGDPSPSERILSQMLAFHLNDNRVPLDPVLLDHQLEKLRDILKELEARGSRILFFEMPVRPEIAASPRARQVREAFDRSFKDHRRLDPTALAKPEPFRTMDGVHLTPAEASLVARRIRELIEQESGVSGRSLSP